MKRRILWLLALVLAAYVGFVAIDCVRLRNGTGRQPLVTWSTVQEEHCLTHRGLGYTVSYYQDIGEEYEHDGIRYVELLGYGAEFRWLGILIWAWIE